MTKTLKRTLIACFATIIATFMAFVVPAFAETRVTGVKDEMLIYKALFAMQNNLANEVRFATKDEIAMLGTFIGPNTEYADVTREDIPLLEHVHQFYIRFKTLDGEDSALRIIFDEKLIDRELQ